MTPTFNAIEQVVWTNFHSAQEMSSAAWYPDPKNPEGRLAKNPTGVAL
jgi:hypothetical protein